MRTPQLEQMTNVAIVLASYIKTLHESDAN